MSETQTAKIQNTVDVWNPNIRFGKPKKILFGFQTLGFQTFGLFGYTINFRNPNIWLVESINPTSEIKTFWKWDNFGKRQNPKVRISDVYCMPKYKQKGIQNSDSLDFRRLGFWNYTPIVWNCTFPSSLWRDKGSGIKRICSINCYIMLYNYPFYFNVWNPNSKFCLDF